ncbi:unnamed protein product [Closterium sp. NIES-65]|nr:unnamed protein product [Closterium sp. NIES-65]
MNTPHFPLLHIPANYMPLALCPLPSVPCPLPLALSPLPSPPCPLPLALSPLPSPPCPLPAHLFPSVPLSCMQRGGMLAHPWGHALISVARAWHGELAAPKAARGGSSPTDLLPSKKVSTEVTRGAGQCAVRGAAVTAAVVGGKDAERGGKGGRGAVGRGVDEAVMVVGSAHSSADETFMKRRKGGKLARWKEEVREAEKEKEERRRRLIGKARARQKWRVSSKVGSCTPVVQASGACQWCTPVVHASGACQWCMPVVHASGACQWCMPVVHASGACQWCMPVVHASGACQWCMPVVHASGACQCCMPVLHASGACQCGACQWCMPVVHASGACQRCMPVVHASGACQWCMPVVHASGACQWCMPVVHAMVHASGACQWCMPVVHASGACQWCMPVVHASGACQWCMPVVHANGACQWCMPVVHASDACQWCMPVVHASAACQYHGSLVMKKSSPVTGRLTWLASPAPAPPMRLTSPTHVRLCTSVPHPTSCVQRSSARVSARYGSSRAERSKKHERLASRTRAAHVDWRAELAAAVRVGLAGGRLQAGAVRWAAAPGTWR